MPGHLKKISSQDTACISIHVDNRIYFLDNIKLFLAFNVIILHAAYPYGNGAGWPISHPEYISPLTILIIETILAVGSSYCMGLFFFIIGYFTPNSYQQKGGLQYLKSRLFKLGVPLLIYIVFIFPFIGIFYYSPSKTLSLQSYLSFFTVQNFSFGYMWFVVVMIFLVFGYTCWRSFNIRISSIPFPNTCTIVCIIILLSLITFVVRIWYPFEVWIGFNSLKPAQAPMFFFMFISGILAYRNNWFKVIPSRLIYIWGTIALFGIELLPLICYLFSGGITLGTGGITLGGFTMSSFTYAFWEFFMGISIGMSLIILFRDFMDRKGPIISVMSKNVYSIYLINIPIILIFQWLLIPADLPLLIKFFVVTTMSIPSCFLISNFIVRKIPFAESIIF